MYSMRKITCSNEDNIAMTFGDEFTPWLLQFCEGIYSISNKVYSSENTMTDGSTFLGSTTVMRNIVLGLVSKDNHAINRNLLYQLFKPKSKGIFTYIEQEGDFQEIRTIDYFVESIEITGTGSSRRAEVSLLCLYPFFQDIRDHVVSMSGWESRFVFPHEFNEPEELGIRRVEKLKQIDNESSADNIGLTITIIAESAVTNPSMYHVECDEFIKIGTKQKPLILNRGDVLIITTHTNNKNVSLKRSGVTNMINEYLDEDSTFLQLQNGKNNLRYGADSGEDYMNVTVGFRYRYPGV